MNTTTDSWLRAQDPKPRKMLERVRCRHPRGLACNSPGQRSRLTCRTRTGDHRHDKVAVCPDNKYLTTFPLVLHNPVTRHQLRRSQKTSRTKPLTPPHFGTRNGGHLSTTTTPSLCCERITRMNTIQGLLLVLHSSQRGRLQHPYYSIYESRRASGST